MHNTHQRYHMCIERIFVGEHDAQRNVRFHYSFLPKIHVPFKQLTHISEKSHTSLCQHQELRNIHHCLLSLDVYREGQIVLSVPLGDQE